MGRPAYTKESFNKLIKWGSDSLTNRENSYDIVNYENCIDNVLIEYDDLNPIGKDITFNNFVQQACLCNF